MTDTNDGPLTAEEALQLDPDELEAYRWAQSVFRFFKKVEERQISSDPFYDSQKLAGESIPEG